MHVSFCSATAPYIGVSPSALCGQHDILNSSWKSDVFSVQTDSTVTITCADRKWNKQVSCEPVDCGLPDKYHVHPAQFDFPEGTTFGKKSTFQCKEPAQLVGEKCWKISVLLNFDAVNTWLNCPFLNFSYICFNFHTH